MYTSDAKWITIDGPRLTPAPSTVLCAAISENYADCTPEYITRMLNTETDSYTLIFSDCGTRYYTNIAEYLCTIGVQWKPFNGNPADVIDAIYLNNHDVIVKYLQGNKLKNMTVVFTKIPKIDLENIKFYLCGKRAANNSVLTTDAIVAGYLPDGRATYVCLAHHNGDMVPGRYDDGDSHAHISYGFAQHYKEEFSLLYRSNTKWVKSKNGQAVIGAIVGGFTQHRECLYFARSLHDGHWYPGKVHRQYRMAYVCYNDTEVHSTEYEVLVDAPIYDKWLRSVESLNSTHEANKKSKISAPDQADACVTI